MQIGFDLGGTKMLAALLERDSAGDVTVVDRVKKRTQSGSNDVVLSQIVALLDEIWRDDGSVSSIGIAVPGPIDTKTGVILDTPNIGVRDLHLGEILEKRFKVPVHLENDVNAGLWGEFIAGSARGFTHVIGIFPGTGIGGGLILNGQLYRGKQGAAGEIGHMIMQSDGRQCGCGGHGCYETVASKTAIARDLVLLAMNGQAPTVQAAGGTDITRIKSKVILKAYQNDGKEVRHVVDQAAEFLGIGMATLVNIFDPEAIVLGGGLVEKLGDTFIRKAEATMRERAMPRLVKGIRVLPAQLGDDSVVVGAADLAERSL